MRKNEFMAPAEMRKTRNRDLACPNEIAEQSVLYLDGLDRKQLYAGWVDRAAAALKPRRGRSKAVAACIRTCEANRDRMCCAFCRNRGMPVGFGVYDSSRISRARFWTSLRRATRMRRSRSIGRRIRGGSSPPAGEGRSD